MSFVYGLTYHIYLYFITLIYAIWICLIRLASVRLSDAIMSKTNMPMSKMLLLTAGVKLSSKGREYIEQMEDQSYIIVCNHVTTLDVPVLMVGLNKHNIKYVYSLRAAANIPLIGKFVGIAFNALGWISIKHNTDDTTTLKRVINVARREKSARGKFHFAIFPEGIRTSDGSITDFQEGPFYLSMMLQVPIIPVMTKGIFSVHRFKTFRVHPGRVGVEVMQPIFPPKLEKGQLRTKAKKLCLEVQDIYKQAPDLNTNPDS